ncbi:MAG: hypothetical protein KJ556_00025 [Gammaproteobacteria bacterium]|nr:hypothetical protein [Gammaproteobacteria bacterium]MBU2058148.1 hypothetical protein [Gammaproteobacteria bacterium]MBU2173488.1 hypothetical protein [Gammaproteobacteria bacterium]MBU2248778.1 hypothetical protein [Gammaproteobacteria bacterium]MBU2342694.1 hypothetical protein [Gammaproteobacteria bacterium]
MTAFLSLLNFLPTLRSIWPLQSIWLLPVFGLLQLLCLLVFALLVSMLEKNQRQINTGRISPAQGQ